MTAFNFISVLLIIFMQTKFAQNAPPEPIEECTVSNINIDRTITQELLKLSSPTSEEEEAIFQEELGCGWKKRKFIDDNGYLSVINFSRAFAEELLSQYPENIALNKAQQAANYCSHVKGASNGESAIKILRCLGRWKAQSFINDEINQSLYKDVVIKTKKQ